MPQGDALMSGLYLNELLMRLLARDDPYAALFDIYAGVVRVLAGDRVTLEVSPYDLTRGRITFRHKS